MNKSYTKISDVVVMQQEIVPATEKNVEYNIANVKSELEALKAKRDVVVADMDYRIAEYESIISEAAKVGVTGITKEVAAEEVVLP